VLKKQITYIVLTCLFFTQVHAQFEKRKKININDSSIKIDQSKKYIDKYSILMNLGRYYQYYKGDSAILFFDKAADIARKNNDAVKLYETLSYISITARQTLGDYPLSLRSAIESMKVGAKINYQGVKAYWYQQNLAQTYAGLNNKKLALKYINEAWPIELRSKKDFNSFELSRTYFSIREIDSSFKYIKKSLDFEYAKPFEKWYSTAFIAIADVFKAKGSYDSAIYYYKIAIQLTKLKSAKKDYLEATSNLSDTYFRILQLDSAIHYGNNVIQYAEDFTFKEGVLNTYEVLYQSYKSKKIIDSSYKYLEKYKQLSSELRNSFKINEAQNIALTEVEKLKELEEQRQSQQKKLYLIALVLISIAIGIYFYGRRRQKILIQKNEVERKDKELQAAKDLQTSLLPKVNPKRDDLDIATFIRSSTEVGGDYYDFVMEKDGTIVSICGDATGHGVASGMMVSVTKAALKGIGIESPNITLQQLNNIVKDIDLGKLRMSLNIVKISSGQIELSSAAMPPIYLFKAINKVVEEIQIQSLPLGGLRNIEFDSISRTFESGDVLIQLSDGLPEAPNAKGEMYDYEKLKSLILSSCHLSAQEIINVLMQSVDQWLEGKHNPDDITIVITKKK
jgi:serine phosphatase RsbU (regulator of sigma subunit)